MDAGQQLGEYIIEAEIGGGGMAKVYRARHAVLETLHAVKVLDAEYRANAEARRRFLDEAKIQAKHLTHPNIVKVTNIIATADAAALVMELIEGGSLEAYITAKGRPFTADELLQIAVPILDALGHAHDAGIIHRDVKPANILLRKVEGRLVPVIIDFGIAKVADGGASKKSTHHEARMGTLGYMSPEQIRKAKDVTTRSDIFSLGAMFYEMATGKVPFDGESDFDIMEKIVHGRFEPPEKLADPSMPSRITAAIRRAMAPAPEKRFASCRELAAALTGGKAIKAAGLSGATEPEAQRRRWPLVVLLVAAGAGLAGGAAYMARKASSEAQDEARDAAVKAGSGSSVVASTPVPDAPAADAAEIDAPPPSDAPSDASSDASVDAPAQPRTSIVPPPPSGAPSCKGRWSGPDLRVVIGAGRTCGTISFAGGTDCTGALTGCSDGATFTASYSCKVRDVDASYVGTITMSCTASSVRAAVVVNGKPKTKLVKRM